MSSTTLPLSAGALTSRLRLQSRAEAIAMDGVIVPTWSDVDTVWGRKRGVGLTQQLESEAAGPRRAWEIDIRRRRTALVLPLRVLHGDQTMFALAAIDDESIRDQTLLHCVDGINMGLAESVTVYRGVDVAQADRSTLRTWSPVETDVRVRIDDAETTLVERLFGRETHADLHGTIEIDDDVRVDDGLTITAGRHLAQNFLVTARKIDPRLPAQAYYALALTATTEGFV
jgi:head-tail adaptor